MQSIKERQCARTTQLYADKIIIMLMILMFNNPLSSIGIFEVSNFVAQVVQTYLNNGDQLKVAISSKSQSQTAFHIPSAWVCTPLDVRKRHLLTEICIDLDVNH